MEDRQQMAFNLLFIWTFLTVFQTCVAIYPAYEQSYDQQYPLSHYSEQGEEYEYYSYPGREVLGKKERYILEWIVDYKTKMIIFNITCNCTGWVGLGLSKDGQMKEADIMIGGVRSSGQPYLADMHADYNRKLYTDAKQDWFLISAVEDYGTTYLRVTRPLDSCDPYDFPITMDLLSVLWAFGETDDIDYHFDKRGSFRVYLLDPILKTYEKPLEVWQARTRITMPTKPTSYICVIQQGPILAQKHHIVEAHVYLENPIAVEHTHHIIVWRCVAPPGLGADVVFEPFTLHPGEECYFNNAHVLPHLLCKFLIFAWAIGGEPFILPYSVGIPLGEGPAEYYMIETHVNNPLLYAGITFTTGIDFYYTDQLRANDGGAIFVGYDVLGLFMIPPVTTDFEVYGYCTPACTKDMFPESGVEILAVLLHAHVSGIKIKLQHFRNNSELPVILQDENYDSTFQQNRVLYEPRLVLRGDQLVVTCNYDNTWSSITTVSGFATREEMCIAGLLIKIRVPYFTCNSQVPQETLLPVIGVDRVKWNLQKEAREITAPPSLAGKMLSEVTDYILDWDKSLRYRLQEVTVRSTQIGSCPEILAPAGVEGAQTTEAGLLGTIISTTANPAEILTLALGYGVETLMGTGTLPTRTPGPISHANYPFSGARYLGRTCPRILSPFTSYYSTTQRGMSPVGPQYSPPYSYQRPPQQIPYYTPARH